MQNATFWDPGPPPGPSIVIPCGIVTHPQVGDVIDRRYLLVREIDRGGVGAVYEAEHRITQRSVALKLLSEHHRTSPESRARLLREARALTLARHRNVVAALDAGELDDGQPYLVMELMEGRTLSGLLTARRKLGVAETVSVGIQLCDAVSQAHARGVIHRDVKPQNVFVARDEVGEEVIKLFDSWAGSLKGQDFDDFALAPARRIIAALKARHPGLPVIAFPREAGPRYEGFARATGADCVALDSSVSADWAAAHVQKDGCVQGNLDQRLLVTGGEDLVAETKRVVRAFSGGPHIFNLGHGITPDADPANVQRMIDAIRG